MAIQYAVDRETWERQPREPVTHYEAFAAYRDMIYDQSGDAIFANALPKADPSIGRRSVRIIAERYNRKQNSIQTLARDNDWTKRAADYDEFVTRLRSVINYKRLEAMNDTQAALGQLMQAKAMRRIQGMSEDEMSPQDAIRMADTGTKIERIARGAATEIATSKTEHSGTVQVEVEEPTIDMSKLSDEELIAMTQIATKLISTEESQHGRGEDPRGD